MPIPASSTRPAAAAWRRFTRNRAAVAGLALVVFFLLMAAVGPWVAPHDPLKQHLDGALAAPSWSHGLGRDELGRDILSRILHGARISLEDRFHRAVGTIPDPARHPGLARTAADGVAKEHALHTAADDHAAAHGYRAHASTPK